KTPDIRDPNPTAHFHEIHAQLVWDLRKIDGATPQWQTSRVESGWDLLCAGRQVVGRTSWSARVPLDPLFANRGQSHPAQRGRRGRRPRTRGPPHNYVECENQNRKRIES